jgi:hypothetical protein
LLRAAAEHAGCEAVLALAEVKETWDAWPPDEIRGTATTMRRRTKTTRRTTTTPTGTGAATMTTTSSTT